MRRKEVKRKFYKSKYTECQLQLNEIQKEVTFNVFWSYCVRNT